MRFDWDPEKEKANLEKHGISFGEAIELFSSGVDYLEIYDEDHSQDEDRFIAIGPIEPKLLAHRIRETFGSLTRTWGIRPAAVKTERGFKSWSAWSPWIAWVSSWPMMQPGWPGTVRIGTNCWISVVIDDVSSEIETVCTIPARSTDGYCWV